VFALTVAAATSPAVGAVLPGVEVGARIMAVVENPSSVESPADAAPNAGFGAIFPVVGSMRRSKGSGAFPALWSTATTVGFVVESGAIVKVCRLTRFWIGMPMAVARGARGVYARRIWLSWAPAAAFWLPVPGRSAWFTGRVRSMLFTIAVCRMANVGIGETVPPSCAMRPFDPPSTKTAYCAPAVQARLPFGCGLLRSVSVPVVAS